MTYRSSQSVKNETPGLKPSRFNPKSTQSFGANFSTARLADSPLLSGWNCCYLYHCYKLAAVSVQLKGRPSIACSSDFIHLSLTVGKQHSKFMIILNNKGEIKHVTTHGRYGTSSSPTLRSFFPKRSTWSLQTIVTGRTTIGKPCHKVAHPKMNFCFSQGLKMWEKNIEKWFPQKHPIFFQLTLRIRNAFGFGSNPSSLAPLKPLAAV